MAKRFTTISYTTAKAAIKTAIEADTDLENCPGKIHNVTVLNNSASQTCWIQAKGSTTAPTNNSGITLDVKGGLRDNYFFDELDTTMTFIDGSGAGTCDIEYEV